MEKRVLAAASHQKQKYFFAPDFDALPQQVKEEIRGICVIMAERLNCTFLISFKSMGDILFEIVNETDSADFDDIGAELEIKSLRSEKKELIKALKLWYVINMTNEGMEVKRRLLEENS